MEILAFIVISGILLNISIKLGRNLDELVGIRNEQKRIKECIITQYRIQVDTYNVLRLELLKDIKNKHSMYGAPTTKKEIEEKIEEIQKKAEMLFVDGLKIETEDEWAERTKKII